MKVSELVEKEIAPLFKSDIRLVEVEYVKRNDGMHLVVYIDKDGGVSIDDCVAVNNMIDPVIDDLNPTGDTPYCLDVSSYGLDKPLKYDWQFKKYTGELVDVKLYRKIGKNKEFTATLLAYDEKNYQFKLEDEVLTINKTDVAQILPYVEI